MPLSFKLSFKQSKKPAESVGGEAASPAPAGGPTAGVVTAPTGATAAPAVGPSTVAQTGSGVDNVVTQASAVNAPPAEDTGGHGKLDNALPVPSPAAAQVETGTVSNGAAAADRAPEPPKNESNGASAPVPTSDVADEANRTVDGRVINSLADVVPRRGELFDFTPKEWQMWLCANYFALINTSTGWHSSASYFVAAFDAGLLEILPQILHTIDELLQQELLSAIQLLSKDKFNQHRNSIVKLVEHIEASKLGADVETDAHKTLSLIKLRAGALLVSNGDDFTKASEHITKAMLPTEQQTGLKHQPVPGMLPNDLGGIHSKRLNPFLVEKNENALFSGQRQDSNAEICQFQAPAVDTTDDNSASEGAATDTNASASPTGDSSADAQRQTSSPAKTPPKPDGPLSMIRELLAQTADDKTIPKVDPGFSGFGDNMLMRQPDSVFKQIEDFLSTDNPVRPPHTADQVRIVLHHQWLLDYRKRSLKPSYRIEIAITLDYKRKKWRLTKKKENKNVTTMSVVR